MSKKWQDWMVFGEGYRPPTEVLDAVEQGLLVDISYGNDVCPSFAASHLDPHKEIEEGDKWVCLWSDHWIKSEREFDDQPRFLVVLVVECMPESTKTILKTDNVVEALDMVRRTLTTLKEEQ